MDGHMFEEYKEEDIKKLEYTLTAKRVISQFAPASKSLSVKGFNKKNAASVKNAAESLEGVNTKNAKKNNDWWTTLFQ